MISIVICSRDKDALSRISDNIKNTIGAEFEIIAIDNSQKKYGICEAYNIGAQKSQYDILCFMHEDIKFHTENWGQIVSEILIDETIGVLGVAGGEYQIKAPASWWFIGHEHVKMQVLHSLPGMKPELDVINSTRVALADVAVLDGLWLCSRKAVWTENPFDEKTFTEFHFYDVDYCTNIYKNYKICVTFDILVEHFSKGSINKDWLINCIKYQSKWRKTLPFGVVNISDKDRLDLELKATEYFIKLLISNKMPFSVIVKQIFVFSKYNDSGIRFLKLVKRVAKSIF